MKSIFLLIILTCALNGFAGEAPGGTYSTAAPASTNELVAPTHLDRLFTNSADMELVQVGSLWVGSYEVTQKEYSKVMGGNPSAFGGDTHPVDSLSYHDALTFCQKMTEMDDKKKLIPVGYHYDLPTEEEWASFVANATPEQAIASLNGSLRSGTSAVGTLPPNSLGLYDILGNVMEFVRSDESKPYRILKGGSWQDRVDVNLRPEFRWYATPDEGKSNFGFRCVLRGK